ncbi:MAG: phage tail sheath C-terminal domain-containing protein [Desulfitobacterium sp.]
MPITLPSIEIAFKQLALDFIARSARGVAVLIVKDDTDTTFDTKEYKSTEELSADSALYTATNYQYIADVLEYGVNKVVVVKIATTETMADALALVASTVKTGWITTVGVEADYTALTTWIKVREAEGKTYKAIVYNAAAPDCKHVVNFTNTNVVFADTRGSQTGDKYLPSLLGILASSNVERGVTYYVCKNLSSVTEAADNDVAVNAGKFILINDFDEVKVGLGVNSLTTFAGDNVEDMRYIDVVETMDMITDDIRETFKSEYIGQYKNSYENQILFISAVNTYFSQLAEEDILDPDYVNFADVNVAAQRSAWALLKPEAVEWDDVTVKNAAYKRTVFLAGDIKILGSMENLKFDISMF